MPATEIWLLLVGINFYPNEANRLRGAVNDVSDIESSLKRYYREINVIKLVASVTGKPGQTAPPEDKHLWPTWVNFTDNLKHITQKAFPNDIVWVHFSGHGTLRPTKASEFSYLEDYGTDAALVLLEPDARCGVRYLRGIELARFLDDMVNKGLKITVLLDSCHSGSISRGEDPIVRGISWNVDVDSEFPLQIQTPSKSLVSKKEILRDANNTFPWLLHPQGYTLLAACGPHELAKEICLGKKQQYYGALSYHVLEALDFYFRSNIQDATHELFYQRIRAKMHHKLVGQHPILIGAKRTTLFGTKVANRKSSSTCEVTKVSGDNEIWLNTGLVNGIYIGDKYTIYSQAEAAEHGTCVTITDIHATEAVAKPISSTGSKEDDHRIQVGFCATLTSLAQPRAYVKLSSEIDTTLEGILEKSIWLQRFPMDELAPMDTPCFSVVKTNGQQYTILDSKDCYIPNMPSVLSSTSDASDRVLTILEHLSKFTFVQALNNRRPSSLIDSDFLITANAEADYLNTLGSDNSIIVPHNSKVDITFQNLTNEVLYFAVLNLTPLRRIKHLYPARRDYQVVMPHDPQEVLPKVLHDIDPSGVVRLKPHMTVLTRLMKQQCDRIAEDVLKFFVSTCPVYGTNAMELPDLWDAVERDATTIGSADEAFGALMRKTLVEESEGTGRLRGETKMARWACRSITIRTVLGAS